MKDEDTNGLILIIDDNPINVQQVKDMLTLHGYQSITAESASEGLEIVKTVKPELILLDIVMPEINGFSFCKTLKSNQTYSDIPIIIFTAHPEYDTIDKVYKAGANDFIKKPIKPHELASRIKIQLKNADEEKKKKKAMEKMRKQLISLRKELEDAKKGKNGKSN